MRPNARRSAAGGGHEGWRLPVRLLLGAVRPARSRRGADGSCVLATGSSDGRGGPRAGAARARSRAYRDAYTVSTCIVIVE